MIAPYRIQRKRTKGWRAPENAVNCDRNSIFGNPWAMRFAGRSVLAFAQTENPTITPMTIQDCVDAFREWLSTGEIKAEWRADWVNEAGAVWLAEYMDKRRVTILAAIPSLTGKALMCWCAPDQPCHCDVLIEKWVLQ